MMGSIIKLTRLQSEVHIYIFLFRNKSEYYGKIVSKYQAKQFKITLEPFQFFKKYRGLDVIVSEKRIKGIRAIDQMENQI